MVNYQCYRCGYTNKDKSKIHIHLKRKTPCKVKLNNIEIDECKEYILEGLSYDEYLKHYNPCKSSANLCKSSANLHSYTHDIPYKYPKNEHNVKEMSKNDEKSENLNKCEYCKRVLSSYKNLWRHLKTCNEKKKEEQVKESMKELVSILNKQNNDLKEQLEKQNNDLKEQLEKQNSEFRHELDKRDKHISELIQKAGINNSTITQNIQNNIKLLAYKDTDISNLTDKDILKCMSHSNMCVPHLVKMIHFDPKKPENHNVYISNLKNGYIMAYDGSKWDTLNRDEIIEDIISDKQGLIEERIENWIEEGKKYPTIMKKFERYLEKKENNIVINKIKEEIKLMLFNNRSVVKK